MKVHSNLELNQDNDLTFSNEPEVIFNSVPIPREILHKCIFPRLNNESLVAVAETSKQLQNEVINYSTDINYNSIIYFANFLSEELAKQADPQNEDEINRLINLTTSIPNTAVNLLEIKRTAPQLKKEIVNILKDLQVENLNLLEPSIEQYLLEHENLSQFEKFFIEVQCHNSLKDTKSRPNNFDKIEALIVISDQFLLELGDKVQATEALNEALESAKAIPDDDDLKGRALMKIFDKFLELEDNNKALEVTNSMRIEEMQVIFLHEMIKLLLFILWGMSMAINDEIS